MTGPLATLLLFLFPPDPIVGSVFVAPDTPAADVVRIKPPYALVKHRSKGPNPPTELVSPYRYIVAANRPGPIAWLEGQPMETAWADMERVALAGDWLASQDRMGRYNLFDLSEPYAARSSESSLDAVNDCLARHGCGPVSDADFHTFEQLAEERDRQRTMRSLAVLSAVTLGWLAVAGVAFWFRRRMV